jgi:hypothetical protein
MHERVSGSYSRALVGLTAPLMASKITSTTLMSLELLGKELMPASAFGV